MKSGVQITSAVVLVGVIVWLFIRIEGYKDAKADQQRELHRLEWSLLAKEAENDSIKGIGQYSDTLTVWRTITVAKTDTVSGKVDTVYEDIPTISGSISIDTTKEFGFVTIRVWGKLYYPEEFSHKNRLLIHPIIGEKMPIMPVTRRQKTVGIGLNYSRSFSEANSCDYFGGFTRYKRLSFNFGYDFWQKSLISGISMELVTF